MLVDLIESVQSFSLMVYHAARYSLINFRSREVLIQMDRIGVGSVPIVFLASLFAGLDMALQFEVVMAPYGAKALLGKVVTTSIVRDMGPVMASLVMSARVTSGIASEVGMMQATSQIEALSVMGVDPIDQIVAPRILSGIVMMPILSVIGDFLGIFGGLVIAFLAAHIPAPLYWSGVREALTLPNLVNGAVKPIFFGFILTSVGCFYGMKAGGGAAMVGRTTTRAVVAAAVWILVANFLISKLLLNLWGNEG